MYVRFTRQYSIKKEHGNCFEEKQQPNKEKKTEKI